MWLAVNKSDRLARHDQSGTLRRIGYCENMAKLRWCMKFRERYSMGKTSNEAF
jgi:hypothetical protein